MTQYKLAELTRTQQPYIHKIENGLIKIKPSMAKKFGEIFGVNWTILY